MECDTVTVGGVVVGAKRDRALSEEQLDEHHALLFSEVKRLRQSLEPCSETTATALQLRAEAEAGPEADPEAEPEAEPEADPGSALESTPEQRPAVNISAYLAGQSIILPPHHPNRILSTVSLHLRNWSSDISFQSADAVHRAPKGSMNFPHILSFDETGTRLYTIETQRSCVRLELNMNSPIASVPDLMSSTAHLVTQLNGPNAERDALTLSQKIEFEAFVIRETTNPMHQLVDHTCRPSHSEWPYAQLDTDDYDDIDDSKPHFLQTEKNVPIKSARACLSHTGQLIFLLRFRDAVLSSRAKDRSCGRVRLAVKPISATLSKLKGWTFISPPFEIRSKKRKTA